MELALKNPLAGTLKISSHGDLAVKETLMRNFNQICFLLLFDMSYNLQMREGAECGGSP